jgi:carbonic anhydrase
MEKLVKGFLKFRGEVFGKKRDLFTRLSQKQEPRALFITCSDSRVDPTLMTQAEPGELFILRNAGNMVPPYGSMQGGSTATIEYAMAVLKVPHIIVCGHTDCGVMRALLHPEDVHDLPAVKEWTRSPSDSSLCGIAASQGEGRSPWLGLFDSYRRHLGLRFPKRAIYAPS